MDIVIILVLWVALSIGVGLLAGARGRSPLNYALLALLASPLIAGVVVAILPNMRDAPSWDTHAACPMCAEFVLRQARRCKHCGHEFETTAGDDELARRYSREGSATARPLARRSNDWLRVFGL